ncbi:hypothetical protein [Candidatus Electrothrix sp.]|uniref:hypothetical protein n=2 Tax=Candidatus Electrothrix sp. TaxID=2170559 RepID=UPI0040573FD1
MNDLKLSDNGRNVFNFPEAIPGQFIITDKELDQNVYEQFMTELEWLDPQPDYAMLLRQGQELSGRALSLAQKKNILAQLARWGTVDAYQLVQKYCKCCDSSLEPWSQVALYECRMRMESDLLDEPVGLISTGLGGDGERLRYIFVLALQAECPGEEKQQEMREALDMVCRKHRSRVEELQFHPSYLFVQVLVPIDVAAGKVIEGSIARLNRQEEQVGQNYMATNVAVPTEEEIQKFLGG